MAQAKNLEQRLKAALEDPNADNERCSECDRVQNKPEWAATFICPVDQKRLGVVCCKKCYNLFRDVNDEDCNFTIKRLSQLNDWTEQDIEALEISGNRLVNTSFEATVTNEKDGRDRRKYGYQAFFFEKYVNLSHLDEVIYKQMIAQSTKALVEKRLQQSLHDFKLKKQVDLEASFSPLSFHGDDYMENKGHHDSELEELQRTYSAKFIRDHRNLVTRRRVVSRNSLHAELVPERKKSSSNLRVDERTEDGGGMTQLSRETLDSLRRELLGDDHQKKPTRVKDISGEDDDGPRRSLSGRRMGSNRRIGNNEDLHASLSSIRLSLSRNNLQQRISNNGDFHRSLSSIRQSSSRNTLKQQIDSHENLHGSRSNMLQSCSKNSLQQRNSKNDEFHCSRSSMRQSSSRNNLQWEGGMKRSTSKNCIIQHEQEGEGMKRFFSRNKLLEDGGNNPYANEQEREDIRREVRRQSSGRHRLSRRAISAVVDM